MDRSIADPSLEQLRDEGDVLILTGKVVATSANFEVTAFAPVRTI